MEYPILNVKSKSRQMVDVFGGYNHNPRIGDGEFYDMQNMTSDYYPVLAPRGKRGVYNFNSTGNVKAMIAKEKICYVNGSDFYVGDDRIEMGLSDSDKYLVSMGAYVIIMPDRKYINTIKTGDEYEWGDIDATYTSEEDVTFTLCTLTGDTYDTEGKDSDVAPENPENGQLWVDTSSTPHTIKKYSSASAMWVSIPTTYIKISSKGIGKNFKQYDGVNISGIADEELKSLNASHALWGCKDDELIIIGLLDKVTTQTAAQGAITVERKMPVMDFVIESNNRLWGCRYGTSENGDTVNEIYASKLGDFKNWNCFMNISTDSCVLTCGTDGPFTGAITHLGYPLFFKENYIHKVYGNYPANFQSQSTECRGVQKGSSKSLAIVNETLFYKSTNAVCAYDGSLPVEMSSALGDVRYSDAVACAYGNKYYISMKDVSGNYNLFVYDTAKGMWHKEDDLQVESFCPYLSEIYAIAWTTGDKTRRISTMFGSGNPQGTVVAEVPWMVETGLIGMTMPDMKYISRLLVRMSLDEGSSATISIQYDSMGAWEQVYEMEATSLRTFSIPIKPRRCDHFRIRIEGEGDCRIYSITKTIEQGSDIS